MTVPSSNILIQCDDCGESPILGTYYSCNKENRSVTHVCQLCLQENRSDQVDDFDQHMARNQGDTSGHAVANSLEELTDLLQVGSGVGEIDLYVTTRTTTPPPDTELLCELLQGTTILKSLQVFVRGTANLAATVQALAEALTQNRSVVLLRFSICATEPQSPAEGVAQALQELLESNHRLRYFYFRNISRFGLDGTNEGGDQVADHLFQSLAKSSLYRFTYEGHTPTSENNKQKAILAIQTNSQLRSIETPFEVEDCQLEIAITDRDKLWTARWTKVDSTKAQQLEILDEIQQAEFNDKVSAFNHYLSQDPSLILATISS